MSNWQKAIKYGAILLGIFLILIILILFISIVIFFTTKDYKQSGFTQNYNNVTNLEIDLDNATLEIKKGSEFKIEMFDVSENFKTYKGDNVLYIKEENFWFWNKNHSRVTIYVPSYLDKLEIDIDAGKLILDNLNINALELDTGSTETNINNVEVLKADISGGVGKIFVTNSIFNNLELETGVGEINWEGKVTGRSKIETGVGNVNLTLLGGMEIYKLNIDKGLGNIKINENKYNGKTYGEGSNIINLETGVGNVNINFG